MGVKTDLEYWETVQHLVPKFIEETYDKCSGWKCGVIARVALRRFHEYVSETGIEPSTISYHTFYRRLRDLGYDVPIVKSYDQNTRIKGIMRREPQ